MLGHVVECKITGIPKVDAKLKALDKKVRNKYLRKALRAGAKVAQRDAKRSAPKDTGLLRKSLKVRSFKPLKKGAILIGVKIENRDAIIAASLKSYKGGVQPEKRKDGGEYNPKKEKNGGFWYPAALEYGRKIHGQKVHLKCNGWMVRSRNRSENAARAVAYGVLHDLITSGDS